MRTNSGMAGNFEPTSTITNKITTGLTRIERARGFLEAATLSEDWIKEMGQRALVLEAHHTTHIEGTRLTLDQAVRLLAGNLVPEADPDDARELLNYRKALDFVSEFLASGDRLDAPGALHHIVVQGINRRKIFLDDRDRVDFLDRLANILSDSRPSCFAWSLMATHCHLLLRMQPSS